MSDHIPPLLLVGEIYVDVTLTPPGEENKLRLGGVAHAARGLWAAGRRFAVAAFVPEYLVRSAQDYLAKFGCERFVVLGLIDGAPNVILIFDPKEVDDQKYETLLRDEKTVSTNASVSASDFLGFSDALVFPGKFDLAAVCSLFPSSLKLHLDVAYDVDGVDEIAKLHQHIETIFISTSSRLFDALGSSGFGGLVSSFSTLKPNVLVLKENRGGCRIHHYSTDLIEEIPAQLGETMNSVGVGDVFDAAYVAQLAAHGPVEAAWRAASASSAYAQTTEPDLLEAYVRRNAKLSLTQLKELGGTVLPWEERRKLDIYLAAPDFADGDRRAVDRALSALKYHNFSVRRPVIENGELPAGSDDMTLTATYTKDVELLKTCRMVFAIPTGRDPGTLVEIGLAIAYGIPVVVYDVDAECNNTMVVAGSACYSPSLDACLNATFECLSRARAASQ
jgi:nucleoside 2-deoxyribosyltransferase